MSGDSTDASAEGERLQKVLAAAGVASRRVSEQYIVAGRVSVNGQVVTELGRRVDPLVDEVAVDGTAVQLDSSRRYLILNKPTGVVSTMNDEHGRPDLRQFLPDDGERLFNVGRLDADGQRERVARPLRVLRRERSAVARAGGRGRLLGGVPCLRGPAARGGRQDVGLEAAG